MTAPKRYPMKRLAILSSAAAFLLAALPARALIDAALQMQLGNPSGATADTNNYHHYLIQRPVEALDYNATRGLPNWVSWNFTSADVSNAVARSPVYFTDTNLPPNFYRVTSADYAGSGWDRGHLCPSADRLNSRENNDMVFLMSNIMPQASSQNSGVWAQLEGDCRKIASTNNEMLIICGPSQFTGDTIASGRVAVPGHTWKIAVVVPLGSGSALDRIDYSTRVIAVTIPNSNSVGSTPWTNFLTSVNELETETGFTFFTALPPNLAAVLRSKVDGQLPPAPAIAGFWPASGSVGASVSIAGTNLNFTTNVTFGGVSASFLIHSSTNLSAIVPAGASSGPIVAATLGGTAAGPGTFIVGANDAPDLAIAITRSGDFTQGDANAAYTIIVTNLGPGASSGVVAVTNILPAGLSAVGWGGPGWTADLGTLTCTRADSLPPGSAYPPITLTVKVAANAPACVTNMAVVSGAGDPYAVNNTALEVTIINPAAAPTVVTGIATGVGTTTATLNGTVNPNGQPAQVHFEYGPTTNYGATAFCAGTYSGTTPQAVSADLEGLLAGATYHFRVVATNVLGATAGADQTFTTGGPDLAVSVAHHGDFVQGYICSYILTVTNLGDGASLGAVTVTNTLPAGLTACGLSGDGWETDLSTLTCTRADSLAAGAAYPAIILSALVATNAPASVTHVAAVSGGGENNLDNNTADDPTTINPAGGEEGGSILAGWNVSALSNYGPSPLSPTTNAAHLAVEGLTRGAGVGTGGTAAARAWGGTVWTSASAAAAISSDRCATFSAAASNGYTLSFAAISRFDYRRSPTGPTNGLLQCQLGTGDFITLAAVTYPTAGSGGASLSPILLSSIPALQNIGPGTNVTFRIVNWAGTSSAGTWYIFDVANSAASDFEVLGTVAPAVTPAADLAIHLTHAGNFTQGDLGRTCTLLVTNCGTAPTTGAVMVTNLLPAGLVATAIGGSGWTSDLGALACSRSDALAAGASYPPITVTVNVATNAPASLTNLAVVAGGGETNMANNVAHDPITIIALAPIELWRLHWFGTTANSGPAADTAVAAGDGLPNLLKYALGLNPLVPAGDPVAGDIASGYLRLTVPKNPDAVDVTFHVEAAAALDAAWATNNTTVEINTATLLRVRANDPVAGSAAGFIRLRISRP